jgi:hypothetical protein
MQGFSLVLEKTVVFSPWGLFRMFGRMTVPGPFHSMLLLPTLELPNKTRIWVNLHGKGVTLLRLRWTVLKASL